MKYLLFMATMLGVCEAPGDNASLQDIQQAIERGWESGNLLSDSRIAVAYRLGVRRTDAATRSEYLPAGGPNAAKQVPADKWRVEISLSNKRYRMRGSTLPSYDSVDYNGSFIFDGEETWEGNYGSGIMGRFRGRTPNLIIAADYYGDMIGQTADVLSDARTVVGDLRGHEPYNIHELIPSGKYSLVAEENLDGIRCVVLERPGLDKVWLAADLGYPVVQRFWNWTVGGPIKRKIFNSDFRPETDHLHFPYKCRMEVYGHPRTRPGMHCATLEANVEEIAFDLPDSIFEPEFKPGMRVLDSVENSSYYVVFDSDGTMRREKEYKHFQPLPWYDTHGSLLAIAVAGIAFLLVGMLYWRRKQRNG